MLLYLVSSNNNDTNDTDTDDDYDYEYDYNGGYEDKYRVLFHDDYGHNISLLDDNNYYAWNYDSNYYGNNIRRYVVRFIHQIRLYDMAHSRIQTDGECIVLFRLVCRLLFRSVCRVIVSHDIRLLMSDDEVSDDDMYNNVMSDKSDDNNSDDNNNPRTDDNNYTAQNQIRLYDIAHSRIQTDGECIVLF